MYIPQSHTSLTVMVAVEGEGCEGDWGSRTHASEAKLEVPRAQGASVLV